MLGAAPPQLGVLKDLPLQAPASSRLNVQVPLGIHSAKSGVRQGEGWTPWSLFMPTALG